MKREWLKEIREAQGLTQQDVADRAGIHRATYGQFEQGIRNPSVPTAKSISKVLGFNWTIFFDENGCMKHQRHISA